MPGQEKALLTTPTLHMYCAGYVVRGITDPIAARTKATRGGSFANDGSKFPEPRQNNAEFVVYDPTKPPLSLQGVELGPCGNTGAMQPMR